MTEQTAPVAPVLAVSGLSVAYPGSRRTGPIRVIEDVSFQVSKGETLALVGESGSGKSTIGKAVLGLVPASGGRMMLGKRDITAVPVRQRALFAHELQVIFQDPYGSLNPALRIGDILSEPLQVRGRLSRQEAQRTVSDLLSRVGLPADAAERYPGSFSGGQRQRIAIARAVSVRPSLVICDEPTSALDVSTQLQVLDLLRGLQQSLGMAYLFITHDLALVRGFADRVAVLRHGRIVEEGPAAQVCDAPQDLYTRALMGATPVPDPVRQRERRTRRRELLAQLRQSQNQKEAR